MIISKRLKIFPQLRISFKEKTKFPLSKQTKNPFTKRKVLTESYKAWKVETRREFFSIFLLFISIVFFLFNERLFFFSLYFIFQEVDSMTFICIKCFRLSMFQANQNLYKFPTRISHGNHQIECSNFCLEFKRFE